MIRTQVYLDDHQMPVIKVVAKSRKKSEAQVLREAVERGLIEMKKEEGGNAQALLGLAELGKRLKSRAEADFSAKIDDYLYGDEQN